MPTCYNTLMSATDTAIFLAEAEESLAGAESEFANSQQSIMPRLL
jgi:hypothetical protein